MAKVSKATAADHVAMDGFEGHYGEADDYTIGFEAYTADADLRDLFTGLPDDRCQAPHWGYVITGRLIFHTADGPEEFVAGDAYYVGPGHTPELFAGTEVVEFSPTAELQQTMEVVTRNAEGLG
ncbi:MAG TPA: cupin domain-containing protein [Actinomycetota bacterium]